MYRLFVADHKPNQDDDHRDDDEPPEPPYCHYSFFNRLWRSSCKNIKIRKYLRFAKCSDCVRFREERAQTRGDKARAELNERVRKHHLEVKAERQAYYQRRLLARLHPSRFLSLIIDGADQSRFHLPHLKETDHIR